MPVDTNYRGLVTPDNTRIIWEKSVLDLPEGKDSAVWKYEVELRIHSAMLEVVQSDQGCLYIAADCGLLSDLPEETAPLFVGSITNKAMLGSFREGKLLSYAGIYSERAWDLFRRDMYFEIFSLRITTLNMPDSPAWGLRRHSAA
jgi:hypothetical protein